MEFNDHITSKSCVLTENDFEQMGWHDVYVHAIAFDSKKSEFMLDIDYIFKWIHPEGAQYYEFWIAPCTLIFNDVSLYRAILDCYTLGYLIYDIDKGNEVFVKEKPESRATKFWNWKLGLMQGEISFVASGYTQFMRQKPIKTKAQFLAIEARGGISFCRFS